MKTTGEWVELYFMKYIYKESIVDHLVRIEHAVHKLVMDLLFELLGRPIFY